MEPGFACPVCRAVTTLAIIEPHPTRRGLAIHIAAYAARLTSGATNRA
jgi:hypothetical protein